MPLVSLSGGAKVVPSRAVCASDASVFKDGAGYGADRQRISILLGWESVGKGRTGATARRNRPTLLKREGVQPIWPAVRYNLRLIGVLANFA